MNGNRLLCPIRAVLACFARTAADPRPVILVCMVLIVAMCAGCASAPRLVETRVPVPIECRVDKPQRPAMPTESLQPADPLDRKVKAALAELEIREGYELELAAALDTCTTPLEDPPAIP